MTKKTRLNPGEKRLADQDYWNKLTEEQREWLNQFNKEYYQGIYKEEDRQIHPPEFDRSLKDARNSRVKDIFYMNLIDDKFGDDNAAFENVTDESENQIYGKTDIQELACKQELTSALEELRDDALDMLRTNMDDFEVILFEFQKDTIALVEFVRKNP